MTKRDQETIRKAMRLLAQRKRTMTPAALEQRRQAGRQPCGPGKKKGWPKGKPRKLIPAK